MDVRLKTDTKARWALLTATVLVLAFLSPLFIAWPRFLGLGLVVLGAFVSRCVWMRTNWRATIRNVQDLSARAIEHDQAAFEQACARMEIIARAYRRQR